METKLNVAVFLVNYSIGKSSPVICLLDLLSDHFNVDIYMHNVWHLEANVLKKNINLIPIEQDITTLDPEQIGITKSYEHYITIDPNAFVLCKILFPHSKPIYYSLELYFRDNYYNLSYPEKFQLIAHEQINSIGGLIIQSKERENLFRKEYNLFDTIPSFMLPVTYLQPSNYDKSNYLRDKFNLSKNHKTALHLGGIQEYHSLIEISSAFKNLPDWVFVMHGSYFGNYVNELKKFIAQNELSNVFISEDYFEHIEDLDILLNSADIGIAWYKNVSPNFSTAGRSSGKIPAYLRFGLPILANRYPSTTEAIENTECGICINNFEDIPEAIKLIETNYSYYSKNAYEEYDKIYWFENYRNPLLDFIEKASASLDKTINVAAQQLSENDKHEITDIFINPGISLENMDVYYVRKSILDSLKELLPKMKGVLLDVGCGQMPYRNYILTNSQVKKYIGLDFSGGTYADRKKPDITWEEGKIPLEGNSVDCIMATEVLEHCPEPGKVLAEIFRVLKPDGLFFLTVPFLWPLHDIPYDEYRYTPFSLKRLLSNVGFDQINIVALGGWDASLAQMIGLWIRRAPMAENIRKEYEDILFPFYQQLLERDKNPEQFTESTMFTGLSVTAKKPDILI